MLRTALRVLGIAGGLVALVLAAVAIAIWTIDLDRLGQGTGDCDVALATAALAIDQRGRIVAPIVRAHRRSCGLDRDVSLANGDGIRGLMPRND